MIIRKPYAFLIKNFKKIHILLLFISLFVLYKLFDVGSFVKEYMSYGTYDAYLNPITKHITFWLLLGVFVLVIGTASLIILLIYKKKPWKVYLIPLIEYLALFFVLKMIKSFFIGYTYDVETTDLNMSRDLLAIFQIFQLPALGIFVMRVFGLDINKFNFNTDKEFFELSEKDREEIEISLSIDHNSFIRLFKKLIRNIGYLYEEHKFICRIITGIIGVCLLFSTYKFIFVTNRVYSEGSNYKVNGYTFKINDSYFTDKDLSGNVISKGSNFVIVDITITNNDAPRKLYMENFHLKNSSYDYVTTRKAFANDFKDLGNTYDAVKEFKRDETTNFIIIYKVSNKLKKNRFVLYYQEGNGQLRKIKLKVRDVSKITKEKESKLGDDITFKIGKKEETISFDSYEIVNKVNYVSRKCNSISCTTDYLTYEAPVGYRILKLDFGSEQFEGKDMVDFSSVYGKISYIDSENMEQFIDFNCPFKRETAGKVLYTLIPYEVEQSSNIKFMFTIRDKQYICKIK